MKSQSVTPENTCGRQKLNEFNPPEIKAHLIHLGDHSQRWHLHRKLMNSIHKILCVLNALKNVHCDKNVGLSFKELGLTFFFLLLNGRIYL